MRHRAIQPLQDMLFQVTVRHTGEVKHTVVGPPLSIDEAYCMIGRLNRGEGEGGHIPAEVYATSRVTGERWSQVALGAVLNGRVSFDR